MGLRDFFDSRWPSDCFARLVGSDGALPSGIAGIYCMVIESDGETLIVYIGKAVNIRGRLRGHAGCWFGHVESRAYQAWRYWQEEKGGEPVIFTRAVERVGSRG
jgi:hypothetical protein